MWIEIRCDGCNEYLIGCYYSRTAPKWLREQAEKEGWKKTNFPNGYRCPECQAKLKELEE